MIKSASWLCLPRARPQAQVRLICFPYAGGVYGGLADAGVHREHLLEWQKYTSGGIVLRMFPGRHFFLHSARYALLQARARDLHAQLDGKSLRATVSA